MRKVILLLFLIPAIGFSQYSTDYKELNIGMYSDAGVSFPGCSFLWGKTIHYKSNTLFDFEVGLAFPTIVTGKFGYGLGNENHSVILGVRPWPDAVYLQYIFNEKWLFSFEYITGDIFWTDEAIIFNIGYRW